MMLHILFAATCVVVPKVIAVTSSFATLKRWSVKSLLRSDVRTHTAHSDTNTHTHTHTHTQNIHVYTTWTLSLRVARHNREAPPFTWYIDTHTQTHRHAHTHTHTHTH